MDMMSIIEKTIESNYNDEDKYGGLLDGHRQICTIDWDRMFKVDVIKDKSGEKRRKKKLPTKNKKLSEDEKLLFSLQKSLVLLGSYINGRSDDMVDDGMDNIRIDPKNYDELITNINWVDRESGLLLLNEMVALCERVFVDLCVDDGEWTVRKNTKRLFNEMLLELYPTMNEGNERIREISESIEASILLYAVLMGCEVCKGDMSSIVWSDNLVKMVYFTKANSILCSLGNTKYNGNLLSGLWNNSLNPIDMAFMKRSQLLSSRFEDLEENKLRIYEESGITICDDDYERYNSNVRCKKCKLFHTSFTQLQTRGADEPMTIFYYCHKCKIRGRE